MAKEAPSAKKVQDILEQMQLKLAEIDDLRSELQKEHAGPAITPEKSRAMLEEIVVPSLEVIKEERKKH